MRDRLPGALRRALRPRSFGLRARTLPVSEHWGYDRGTPIDRWYIERFLGDHRGDIRGRVLEVKDDSYTVRFGTGVLQSVVLDVDPANSRADVLADLADARGMADESYDCIILTQTLQLIYRAADAIEHSHRMLVPGGVLLVTVPALSRVVLGHPLLVDHWRFTQASCRALFGGPFRNGSVAVETYGNAVAGAGFLLGYAAEELSSRELDVVDERFPVVVAVRAVRA